MNVFLVGFMGSGKTSLGKQLAAKLNRPFIDLDALIVEEARMPVSEIFNQHGEQVFRELEKKILFRQIGGKNAVVSLGGGAACNDEAWEFLKKNGISIYLNVRPDVLFGRLKVNRSTRPLIAHLDDDALRIFVDEKLKERSPWYERADMIFEKEKDTMSFLVKQLSSYLESQNTN